MASVWEGAAETLGTQLAGSAAGPIGAFAFGQFLSAVGLGHNPQADMEAMLGKILQEIGALQQSINQLKSDMDQAISQVQYDVVAAPIETLIDTNQTLLGMFNDLASAATSADAQAQRTAIMAQLGQSIVSAPATWNNSLVGVAGATGVIEAWNQVVHTHYPFFGPAVAVAIAQHWSFIDAQQAQSVMYCVEWMNNSGDRAGALRTLNTWRENRITQLGMLRGMPYSIDVFTYTNADPAAGTASIESINTPVNMLPPNVVITNVSGGPMMYYLTLMGPIEHGDAYDLSDFNAAYQPLVDAVAAATARPGQSVQTDDSVAWNVPYQGTLVEFLNDCGGNVGNGDADYFATALSGQGFTWSPQAQLRLWTDVNRLPDGTPMPDLDPAMGMGPYRSVFVDGDSWWSPSTNPQDTAWLLFQRRLAAGESDLYWYPNP